MKKAIVLLLFLADSVAASEGPSTFAGRNGAAWGSTVAVQLGRNDFAAVAARFDEEMKKALPEPQLGEVFKQLLAAAGPFRSHDEPVVTEEHGFVSVLVPMRFEKTSLWMKVVFRETSDRISGLYFFAGAPPGSWEPPPYARPGEFDEREVTVGEGGDALPASLSMPKGKGPVPAVALVHGSGPQDRDETVGAVRPFKDLAWGLASRGIAVLRYEKRTKVHGANLARHPGGFTVKEETVDDAILAVRLLRKTSRIDPKRVYVLGHSLGGMLIPRIGSADTSIAGLIVLAGTTRPLPDVVVEQMAYLTGNDAKAPADRKKLLDDATAEAGSVKDFQAGKGPPPEGLLLGAPPAYWLDLKDYRPAEAARALTQRLLVLQGERDYQVTMADFEGWKKALAGRPNVTLKTFPKLNHLFVAGEGKSLPSEYEKAGHVDAAVIDVLSKWIAAPAPRAKKPRSGG